MTRLGYPANFQRDNPRRAKRRAPLSPCPTSRICGAVNAANGSLRTGLEASVGH